MVKKHKFKKTEETPHQNKFGTGQADRAKEELKGLEDLPLIGGLVKGLGKFVDLVEKVEEAGGEIKRKGEIKGLGEKTKGIYGFSIKTGIGGRPTLHQNKFGAGQEFQTFGNIKKTKEGFKITETREPIVDVFDEKDHILIVAELPGVSEDSITLDMKGDILTLEAGDEKRKYAKEILLPAKVYPHTKETSFKNGVLEVRIKKIKETKR